MNRDTIFVNIYIKYSVGGHQRNRKAHRAGNQYMFAFYAMSLHLNDTYIRNGSSRKSMSLWISIANTLASDADVNQQSWGEGY